MKLLILLSIIVSFILRPSTAFQDNRVFFQIRQLGRDQQLFSSPGDATQNLDNEETLMNVHVSITDGEKEKARIELAKYLRAFPFAAVLPVQPLQYLPTESGVEVKFLRKKTQEKGSVDGGMVFMIKEDRDGYDIICKRNSEGQTVQKIFSEKMVIMSLLKHITGEDTALAGELPANLFVESVFHKWI